MLSRASLIAACIPLLLAACADGSGGQCTVTKVGEAPLTRRGPLLTAPVAINGKPVTMVVDTGAQISAVTGRTVTDLRLLSDPRHGTELIGIGSSGLGQNDALIDSIVMAGADTGSTHVAVMNAINTGPGTTPPAGIVGADLLARYDVELDIADGRLALYNVRHCTGHFLPWDGPYIAVAASVEASDRMTIPVVIDGKTVTALIDTGSTRSVIDSSAARRLGVPESAMPGASSRTGAGAAGVNFRVTPYRFKTVQIGDETWHDNRLLILDRPLREADMLLGLDYLQHARVWMSYRTEQFFVALPTAIATR